MTAPIVLASASQSRQAMLRQAGVEFTVDPVRIDEPAIRDALIQEGASPRDVADALAEAKARKAAARHVGALTLAGDQVLALKSEVFGKPETVEEARDQMRRLSGLQHSLLSAAVIYEDGAPIWRHVGEARLKMHGLSDGFIDDYLDRNWNSVRHSVGGYKIEEEGVRLFSHIQGSHFTILGLPLIELLSYLTLRGTLTV